MLDSFPVRSPISECHIETLTLVGVTSSVAKVYGPGATPTRTGAGAYLWTWAENPGLFIGTTYGLQATVMSGLAGFTVVAGAFTPFVTGSVSASLAFTVYNSSFAAADLTALQWATLNVVFARSGAVQK